MTEFLFVSTLNGLIYGMLLFMVSAGLTLVFGMMGVLNFAHASFYMLGAYVGYAFSKTVGFWWGLIAAPVIVGLAGILVERHLLRAVHRHGHAAELLLTFGLAFVIEEMIKLVFGDQPVRYGVPSELKFAAFSVFGTDYPFYRMFMGALALVMFILLYLLLTRTRVGIVVRAATHWPHMVEALGHRVPKVFMAVFGIGSAMAGLAGAVAGPFFRTSPTMALELGVIVFVVVVVGGLGSMEGALIAAVLIGLFSSFSVGLGASLADLLAWVGLGDWAVQTGGLLTLKVSGIAGTMPFLLMLLVLLARPAGLLGDRQ